MKISSLSKKAKETLTVALKKAPFITIRSFKKGEGKGKVLGGDFIVKLKTPSGSQELIVAVKENGQPRIVREAVLQLLNFIGNKPSAYGVIVAPYISPKSADICAKENIGFIDFAGNCRLCFATTFIEQSGHPNPSVVRREQRSLFSPKGERILRVLLANPKKEWRITALAKEADVSLGQVFNVKNLLLDKELITFEKGGLLLKDPDMLFNMFSLAYVADRNRMDFFTLKNIPDFEAELATLCDNQNVRYALTGFSAAMRYAPAVRAVNRAMAYLKGDIDKIAKQMGLKLARIGANVSLIAPYDDGVFYDTQKIDGMEIVSPMQAYLDLGGFRGRGEEAREMIFQTKIKPTW